MKVEGSTLIKDIINMGPKSVETLMSFGMGCIGCPSSQNESIQDAAAIHGINIENLLESLNNN